VAYTASHARKPTTPPAEGKQVRLTLPALDKSPCCLPGTHEQLGGHSTPTEKAEPGRVKCDYKKPKLLCGQVISRFKKVL